MKISLLAIVGAIFTVGLVKAEAEVEDGVIVLND